MVATAANDRLAAMSDSGMSTGWDWKGSYVDKLNDGNTYERFTQFSASPDTTALFAGPARFTGLSGAASLIPIGLADGVGFQSSAGVQPLYEIGSERTFFTRGKTQNTLSMGRMLADTTNILAALTQAAYVPTQGISNQGQTAGGSTTNPQIKMNLSSEEVSGIPFGLLILLKTRGGGTGGNGKVLTAVYLEYCNLTSYGFNIANGAPVISESVSIIYDRPVPVAFG